MPIEPAEKAVANAGKPTACRPTDPCFTNEESVKASTRGLPEAASSTPAPIGDDCCSAKEHEIAAPGLNEGIRRVLQIVLSINLLMFFCEFTAGVVANSTALMADSIDMLGDASVYVVSLYALGRGARWRAGAALMKGGIILILDFGLRQKSYSNYGTA